MSGFQHDTFARGNSGNGSRHIFLWLLNNSYELLKKGRVVFRVISLLGKKLWQWASTNASMVSQSKSSYFGPYLVIALQNQVSK